MKSETIKSGNTKKIREFIVYLVTKDTLFGKRIPFFSFFLEDRDSKMSRFFPLISIELNGKGKEGFEDIELNEPIKVTFERVSNIKKSDENEE